MRAVTYRTQRTRRRTILGPVSPAATRPFPTPATSCRTSDKLGAPASRAQDAALKDTPVTRRRAKVPPGARRQDDDESSSSSPATAAWDVRSRCCGFHARAGPTATVDDSRARGLPCAYRSRPTSLKALGEYGERGILSPPPVVSWRPRADNWPPSGGAPVIQRAAATVTRRARTKRSSTSAPSCARTLPLPFRARRDGQPQGSRRPLAEAGVSHVLMRGMSHSRRSPRTTRGARICLVAGRDSRKARALVHHPPTAPSSGERAVEPDVKSAAHDGGIGERRLDGAPAPSGRRVSA